MNQLKVLKIGQYLAKTWTKICDLAYFLATWYYDVAMGTNCS